MRKIIGSRVLFLRPRVLTTSADQGVCHRDLKPENLLLDSDFTLKVSHAVTPPPRPFEAVLVSSDACFRPGSATAVHDGAVCISLLWIESVPKFFQGLLLKRVPRRSLSESGSKSQRVCSDVHIWAGAFIFCSCVAGCTLTFCRCLPLQEPPPSLHPSLFSPSK